MGRNTWMSLGASVVAAGILMLGATYVTSGPVSAGQVATPTATATTTATTVQIIRTSTPNVTSTPVQTATPVPPTTAPPPPGNTSVPQPTSGNAGVNVKPPNTGSGGSGGSDLSIWLFVLGAASVAAGGGAIFAGTRRR